MTPESQSTRSRGIGAVGEERLGALPRGIALHDRRIPNSKANIDHIVVAPAGVFIVDAKRYAGQRQRRDLCSMFRHDVRLFVGRRDCSKLVAGAPWQAEQTRKVMPPAAANIPIYCALCFVDAEWSLFSRPFYVEGVFVGWPKALRKLLGQTGPLSDAVIDDTARHLAQCLRPA